MPALSSALAYFDMSRTPRTTANLIQGQRDFFGAHGFERIDSTAKGFHGPWSKTPADAIYSTNTVTRSDLPAASTTDSVTKPGPSGCQLSERANGDPRDRRCR